MFVKILTFSYSDQEKGNFCIWGDFLSHNIFFAAEWQNWDLAILIIFYLEIETLWKFLCILFGCCSTQILNFNAKKQFCKYVKNCLKIRVWPNFWIIFNMFAKLVFALKFRIRVLQHPNKMHKNFYKVFITG